MIRELPRFFLLPLVFLVVIHLLHVLFTQLSENLFVRQVRRVPRRGPANNLSFGSTCFLMRL